MTPRLPVRNRFVYIFFGTAAAVLMAMPLNGFAQSLVENQAAARLGLERAWFAQVRVDPMRHKVVQWLLDKDQLFAMTSAGTIQAIDTKTGETLWTTEGEVGDVSAVGIAVNSKYVAMVSAARLYLIDRADGHHLWSRRTSGAISAAPAMSKDHAFVVLLNGLVEGYRLDDPAAFVWQYQSHGRTFQSPIITGKILSWPAGRGSLYVALTDSPRVLFHVETNDEIVVAPAEQAPYLYVGSLDGYLYCFHELTGSERWRYATGFAITSPPAVVGEKVFVASEGPSLHAVDTLTGQPLWRVEGASQFVASGKHHTYGMDRYGALLVLANESGRITGRLATGEGSSALVNDQSDRIFLTSDRGLVQCLHEIGATEPTWHRAAIEANESASEKSEQGLDDGESSGTKAYLPAGEEAEDAAKIPFEAEEPASEPAEFNPFGF